MTVGSRVATWRDGLVSTGGETYRLAREAEVSFLAAAIAYYVFMSMVPLVVLGVVLATTLGGEALADRIVDLSGALLAPSGEELLRSAVRARAGVGGVTIVGLVILVWSALKAFRALDLAFSMVYGSDTATTIVEALTDAIVALTAVAGGILAVLFVWTVISILREPMIGPLATVVLFAVLVVAFLPLYYLFPDVTVQVREVLPGAALAALGWTLLSGVFRVYATTIAGASIYGLLGGVLLVLTWLYLGALILLVGVALNAVRSGHADSGDQ